MAESNKLATVLGAVGASGDVRALCGVEIELSNDGKTFWLNVDGICRTRVTMPDVIPVRATQVSRHADIRRILEK